MKISYQHKHKDFISPLKIGKKILDKRLYYLILINDEIVSEVSPLEGLHKETLEDALAWTKKFFNLETLNRLLLIKENVSSKDYDWSTPFLGLFQDRIAEFKLAPPSSIFSIEMALINYLFPKKIEMEKICFLDFNQFANEKEGFIKIKIGRNSFEEDSLKLDKYIEQTNLILRLDGNKLFTAEKLHNLLQRYPVKRIHYIEDPFVNELEITKYFSSECRRFHIAIDEGLQQIDELMQNKAITPYLKYAIIKPNTNYGISGTIKVAQNLKEHGIISVLSSSFESEVGIYSINKINVFFPRLFPEVPGLDTLKYFK